MNLSRVGTIVGILGISGVFAFACSGESSSSPPIADAAVDAAPRVLDLPALAALSNRRR